MADYYSEMTPKRLVRTVDPQTEPVTLKQVKDFLRIEHDDEDAMLFDMIVEAREACENYTKRSLITQTWEINYNWFPYLSLYMPLRHGPIQSITSIEYTNSADNTFTLDSSRYYLTEENLNGKVVLQYGDIWPSDTPRYVDAVKITAVTGYGDNAEDIPATIRRGIMHYIAGVYENREEGDIPPQAKRAWNQYRLYRL